MMTITGGTTTPPSTTRALRQSALLIGLGLIVEVLTLVWAHPTAFLVFVLGGAALVFAGIARYLLALLSMPVADDSVGDSTRSD